MPKPFSLSVLLRLREAEEEQMEHRLREAANLRHDVQSAIDRSCEEHQKQQQALREAIDRGIAGGEIVWLRRCIQNLEGNMQQLHVSLLRAEQIYQHQQIAYRHARQKREVLSTLRQKQIDDARTRAQRTEQLEQDELYLLRRHYEQRERQ